MNRTVSRLLLPCLLSLLLPWKAAQGGPMSMPGQFGVSPSGAATYTIPI
jgi:hypothetical protein